MIFQDSVVPDVVWTGVQWFLSIIAIVIIGYLALKWGLLKSFPALKKFFYFLVPTYIFGAILTVAIGVDDLNKYTMIEFPSFVFYLCPPLVWDSMFAMGIVEENVLLVIVSTGAIIFLPIWLAIMSTSGISKEEGEDKGKKRALKRFISAWIIISIMGMGLPNFYSFILSSLINVNLLGISLLVWILIAIAIVAIIIFLRRRRKGKGENECQLIDGEWVCPYGKEK